MQDTEQTNIHTELTYDADNNTVITADYLNFEQALMMIKKSKDPKFSVNKNPQYAISRINALINAGYLQEVSPKVFFEKNGKFTPADIRTERLVSVASVIDFLNRERNSGKKVVAIFTDNERIEFNNIKKAREYFGISRTKIDAAIRLNKFIEIGERFVKFRIL